MSNKIEKLSEIRNSIKTLIMQYNEAAGEDLETRVVLLTYGISELYTQEQIDKAFEENDDDEEDHNYGMINGEYIESEGVSAFGDDRGWLPSSLFC